MEQQTTKKKKHLVLWIVLGILVAALGLGAWYVSRILMRPESFFDATPDSSAAPQLEVTPIAPLFPIETTASEGEAQTQATPAPTAVPQDETPGDETPEEPNRLNILLMGIDAYEDGRSTSGTMPHADATMVIAINFDTETVDLISLPRDTFTTAPGYRGFYKLNGVFNVGGGMKDTDAGFQLMCRLAEQWLGGISIPYYYALDFQAVIDIVDKIGGIDFDVDQRFGEWGGTKQYSTGMHHLDGKAVMGYLRIRKGADGKDSSRTARQRRMMVAIFKKLKEENLLTQIPLLINTASSGIYTNTTLSQTSALASYAVQLPTENVHTYAMSGAIHGRYDYGFCFVDQEYRISLIRDIFGIEAEPVGYCTTDYETWLHEIGFYTLKYIRQAEKVLAYLADETAAGTTYTEEQLAPYADCYNAYLLLRDDFNRATDELGALYTSEHTALDKKAAESAWETVINADMQTLKSATETLAKSVNCTVKLSWNVYLAGWYEDLDINEIYVDFR
ncbi:MAG: LCP family protein [Clostridia bacterium]|nr:LCP family protein [Clostridia bacterium]